MQDDVRATSETCRTVVLSHHTTKTGTGHAGPQPVLDLCEVVRSVEVGDAETSAADAALRMGNMRQMALGNDTEYDALIASAVRRAARLQQLEKDRRDTDKLILEVAFSLALDIKAIMDRDGIGAAEAGRRIGYDVRGAQRLRKLADHVADYRAEIAASEHHENFQYPGWRSLVPEQPRSPDDPVETRKLEISRQIAAEFMRGRKADQRKLTELECELERLRKRDVTPSIEPIDDASMLRKLKGEIAEKCGIISDLRSPEFWPNPGSGREPERLHLIAVLSLDDEFREAVARGGIQEKFRHGSGAAHWPPPARRAGCRAGWCAARSRRRPRRAAGRLWPGTEAVPGRPRPPG